jgi:hypothetical protein
MGLIFYYYDGLQPKMTAGMIKEHECRVLQTIQMKLILLCVWACDCIRSTLVIFLCIFEKNYNKWIKCKLSKSRKQWTGLKILVKQNTYNPFLLVQPVQLDSRNLTDENAELGIDYNYRLLMAKKSGETSAKID